MAATSVLKLVLDDKEYEASLRDARKGMQDLVNSMRQSGKSFADLDKSVLDYASSIGNMAARSSDSRTQMRELTQAINDLTIQYRSLTDEEKQSPFGKALNQSIADLTERAGKVKDVMIDTENAIKHASSDTRTFDQLAQGASVATSAFQGLTGAGKLLGIEMGDDVAVIAKLQAAMAVTNSLTTIQTALQEESALMQGVLALRTKAASVAQKLLAATTGDATKAQAAFNAVAKANPLGILATAIGAAVGAFALLGSSADEATEHIDETRRAVEKLTEAANYYIQVAQAMGASQQTIRNMQKDAAKQAFETAKQHADELEKARMGYTNLGLSVPEELTKQYEEAQKLKGETAKAYQEVLQADRMAKDINTKLTVNWQNASTEKEINATINAFKNLRSEVKVGSFAYDEYTRRIGILEKKLPKVTPTAIGGGGGGGKNDTTNTAVENVTGSVADLTAQMSELKKVQAQVTNTEDWDNYQRKLQELETRIKVIKGELAGAYGEDGSLATSLAKVGGVSVSSSKPVEDWQKEMANKFGKPLDVKMPTTPKTDTKEDKTIQSIGQLVGSVSSIASSLENLGIEIPKGFSDMMGYMQAIITIMQAIQTMQTVGSILGIFGNGGIVPKAATGMVVPGNSFSGDNLRMIGVNSGEVILNRAQQGNIVSQLYDGSSQQQVLQPYVSGENILLGVNNHLRRSGQGEIVTTSMLRRMGVI